MHLHKMILWTWFTDDPSLCPPRRKRRRICDVMPQRPCPRQRRLRSLTGSSDRFQDKMSLKWKKSSKIMEIRRTKPWCHSVRNGEACTSVKECQNGATARRTRVRSRCRVAALPELPKSAPPPPLLRTAFPPALPRKDRKNNWADISRVAWTSLKLWGRKLTVADPMLICNRLALVSEMAWPIRDHITKNMR